LWIVRLALRRPYSVAVLCLCIALMSVIAVQRMRVDVLPAIDIPVVIVVWNYPGLTADDMEKRVTYLSERAYSTTVNGISRIESQSIEGLSILKVYFEQGADIGGAIAQVSAVSSTALRAMPPGMQPPSIIRFNASNVPVAQLTISGKDVSEQQLFDYGLNFLRLRLFTIPGLATPAPYGGKQRQVMVDVDPARAAAKGMSLQDVVQALLSNNVILPAGSARIGKTEYDVTLNSSPDQIAAFNDLPLKVVNGVPVLLKDVANVHDGFAVQTNLVRVNGNRATYLAILKKADASTLAVVNTTKDMLPFLQETAPKGMVLKLDFDQSLFVRAAISGVLREALIAALLVSVMILFFLGSWQSTVLVITSIPIAILCGVLGLFITNQTLNLMTLGGLALAVGMLVDDATVEVENIHRNRHLGKPLTVAIMDGAHQIAVPALAATLTICIVFFPVALLEGPAKFLFTPLALAVVFSMMSSYLLSRTLVPSLARKLMATEELHGPEDAEHASLGHPPRPRGAWARFNGWRDRGFARFQAAYGRLLEQLLGHSKAVIAGVGLLLVVTLALLKVVGLDFFPHVDAGIMRFHFRAPVGTRIEETENLIARVEQEIRRLIPAEELETLNSNIGLPQYYNLAFVQTDSVGGQDADILVALKEGHHPTLSYEKKLRQRLPELFPGSLIYFQAADIVGQVLNFGVSAPIDLQVESRDSEKAAELARHLADALRRISGTVDVRISQILNKPALKMTVDRQRASLVGVTVLDVANNLLTSLSSSTLVSPNFWVSPQNGVNYPVVVQTPIHEVRSVDDLLGTPITRAGQASTQGQEGAFATPYLGSVASLRPEQAKGSANHYTVQPIIDVQAGVEGRDLGAVASDINRAIEEVKRQNPQLVPRDLRVTVRGQAESMVTSFKSLGLGLILAVALVYLLLVVLFQSWLDPFIIIAAVPGALMGILWMLALTGTTLNVESFMGAIMAVGIAVSNSILLVSFANEVRVEKRLSPLSAALEAGKTRLRPVLMTALAMILGMLPMALGLGEGGEQNAPLGLAVIGGLLVATFVTLLVVPLVYSLLRTAEPSAHTLDETLAKELGESWSPT
jgi:multidrug efflux pump subunit AcrB